MKVLCTGPEASGTRLLTRIVATGCETVHRSMPHGGLWWDPQTNRFGCDRTVVIVRDRLVTAKAATNAGHVRSASQGLLHRDRAMLMLSRLPGPVLWTCYEAVVAAPHEWMETLAAWLGCELSMPEPVTDENAKHGG